MVYRFLLCALLCFPALGLAGCSGPSSFIDVASVWDEDDVRDHLDALTTIDVADDSLRAVRRVRHAARALDRAGLMPARDPSFLLRMRGTETAAGRARRKSASPALYRSHVAGYVAGRHPSHYADLVLVAADLDRPGAAAVLEVARALADTARTAQTPERSVLFALWAPPRTGTEGLRDFLANPTWALSGVRRVLLVSTDTATVAASQKLLAERGIPSEAVTVSDQTQAAVDRPDVVRAQTLARTLRLTDALYRRLVEVSTDADSLVALP